MPNFDYIAPFYDALVHLLFGDQLSEAKSCNLTFLNSSYKQILILGGGTGEVLELIAPYCHNSQIIYVEPSIVMRKSTQKRLSQSNLILHINYFKDLKDSQIKDMKVDLIITNFFLDMFAQAELLGLVNHLFRLLKVGGLWFFTDFERPKKKYIQDLYIRFMYLFFNISTGLKVSRLPDYASAFSKVPLRLAYQKSTIVRSCFIGLSIKNQVWSKQDDAEGV